MVANGFGNLRTGNRHWDAHGGQRAMDLVTFGVGITTGTSVGGNGTQREQREGNFWPGNLAT